MFTFRNAIANILALFDKLSLFNILNQGTVFYYNFKRQMVLYLMPS